MPIGLIVLWQKGQDLFLLLPVRGNLGKYLEDVYSGDELKYVKTINKQVGIVGN